MKAWMSSSSCVVVPKVVYPDSPRSAATVSRLPQPHTHTAAAANQLVPSIIREDLSADLPVQS